MEDKYDYRFIGDDLGIAYDEGYAQGRSDVINLLIQILKSMNKKEEEEE